MSVISTEQKAKLERRRAVVNKVMFIPIILLLAVIPLIVRLNYVLPKDPAVNMLFQKVKLDDYYSQYKATGIIILTIIMLLFSYLFIEKSEVKVDKVSKIYFICSAVLMAMSIISTIFSEHKNVAVWGIYDRAEGLIMWGCYLVMMLYAFYVVRSEKSYLWIIAPIMFLVVITTIIGAFQYAGFDLFTKTEWGYNLIIPKELRGQLGKITSDYESHKILGTMYHYDYVGSFGAMIAPLFIVLTLIVKGRTKKIVLGIMSLASLFILFGSTARSGVVGAACAAVVGVIIFGKRILKRWKQSIAVLVLLLCALIGLNVATHGRIFERVPELMRDIFQLVQRDTSDFDYKDYIPVRETINESGEVTFVLQNSQMTIRYSDGEIQLYDENGNQIEYTTSVNTDVITDANAEPQKQYTIQDDRFSNITIVRQEIAVFTEQDTISGMLVVIDGTGYFTYKLDETQGITEIDSFSGLPLQEIEAESIGFKGKEKLGSARGYIWSRSLPIMLKKNLLIGSGPDTFGFVFPQNDRLAKWWAYGFTNMTVDKVHNLYLQIGMGQGCIALIAFLVMMITYLIQSFKLYAFGNEYNDTDGMGIGIMLAIIGYLGAGFFNDSVVSVAPIFWILLGTGFAVNYIKQRDIEKENKQAPHRVIKMK